jgi:hypothetical protein
MSVLMWRFTAGLELVSISCPRHSALNVLPASFFESGRCVGGLDRIWQLVPAADYRYSQAEKFAPEFV